MLSPRRGPRRRWQYLPHPLHLRCHHPRRRDRHRQRQHCCRHHRRLETAHSVVRTPEKYQQFDLQHVYYHHRLLNQ